MADLQDSRQEGLELRQLDEIGKCWTTNVMGGPGRRFEDFFSHVYEILKNLSAIIRTSMLHYYFQRKIKIIIVFKELTHWQDLTMNLDKY